MYSYFAFTFLPSVSGTARLSSSTTKFMELLALPTKPQYLSQPSATVVACSRQSNRKSSFLVWCTNSGFVARASDGAVPAVEALLALDHAVPEGEDVEEVHRVDHGVGSGDAEPLGNVLKGC